MLIVSIKSPLPSSFLFSLHVLGLFFLKNHTNIYIYIYKATGFYLINYSINDEKCKY